MEYTGKVDVGGRELTFRSGNLAKQAQGAVEVIYGDTIVLTAASIGESKDTDFFPLTVEYQEMAYSAGKIPGGFFKREGKPSSQETVSARLTDRPIRPMFPDDYRREVLVCSTVLSSHNENLPDVLSINGASTALMIADCPYDTPLGAVRIGMEDDELLVNPSHEQVEEGRLDLVVAGTEEAISMVEASASEVSESRMLDAMDLAHEEIQDIIQAQEAIVTQCQQTQTGYVPPERDEDFEQEVKDAARDDLTEALFTPDKKERSNAKSEVEEKYEEEFLGDLDEDDDVDVKERSFEKLEKEIMREAILEDGERVDNRGADEVRPINIEAGQLPRPHGSSLFTRGETQSLATLTLGAPSETQRLDSIHVDDEKRFMLHYNFPPYSVGEAWPMRGPGRREIGHGLMAESALRPMLPDEEEFPYTMRVVSEILESNGSSSMASICSGSLALMDAGVPIDEHVSGIAMGLVTDGDDYEILTDILGDEDHAGDMDFKVAGTRNGVNSLQMDIKIEGVTREILEEALDRAREARFHILDIMNETISEPREEISEYAPQIFTMEIPEDKIRELIGPGGKNIRNIIDTTGATVDVEDDGTVFVGAEDKESGEQAREMIEEHTKEVEVGEIYEGKVVATKDFGAFVEVLPGQDGLVHISELADDHVNNTEDIVEEGDTITVKCTDISKKGIELSKRAADKEEGQRENQEDGQPRETSSARS
ncbi:MAG: polyribonucleotide nucleotidyltransferase [bacterium]